jgi:predicted nucleotidyltransferase
MEGDKVLADVVKKALFLFDGRLVSVVLFGSRARGTAHFHSDFDLLIVARALPDEEGRDKLALDIAEIGFEYGLSLQIILTTLEETLLSAKTGAPLMFEIYDAHRIIYDKEGVFGYVIQEFAEQLHRWKARKIKDRVWEVPGLAVSRLQ